MRRTGLARGQGMKLAVSSAPKARKVFISHPRVGRRALLGIQAAHLPCAKWSFWWVIFREQTWVTSRERRRLGSGLNGFVRVLWDARDGLPGLNVSGLRGLSLIHISEPTRLGMISYAVFCLKK